jgi:riboflavin transporter FmnP
MKEEAFFARLLPKSLETVPGTFVLEGWTMKRIETRDPRVRRIAVTGILAAVAIVLMYLEFPLPLMPSFLKFDFSEIPILLAGFALGPWSAVIAEFIKNLAHWPATQTAGVGEIANFVMGCAFVVPAALIYRHRKTKASALLGMAVGTVSLVLVGCLGNYFVMIPFYVKAMGFPLGAILGMAAQAGNKLATTLETLVVFVFAPFNLFKGAVISLIVLLVYKKISRLLHGPRASAPK